MVKKVANYVSISVIVLSSFAMITPNKATAETDRVYCGDCTAPDGYCCKKKWLGGCKIWVCKREIALN